MVSTGLIIGIIKISKTLACPLVIKKIVTCKELTD